MRPDPPVEAWIRDPETHGLFVPVTTTAPPELLSRYTRIPPERLSWSRGFLGLPAFTPDYDLPPEAFPAHFQTALTRWVAEATVATGATPRTDPAWIPAAAAFIEGTMAAAGAVVPFAPERRFSFRPALDLLEPVPWDAIRRGLRAAGLPECDAGQHPGGWPMYPTEFARVLTLATLRNRGWNAKVIDNDLNACFDPDNPAENRPAPQVRSWFQEVLGGACAVGPHWWPQDAEEWILRRVAERGHR